MSLQAIKNSFLKKVSNFEGEEEEPGCNVCGGSFQKNGISPLLDVCTQCINNFGYNSFDQEGKFKKVDEN